MKNQMELKSIAKYGQTFEFDDQEIWLENFAKFDFTCKIVENIKAEIFVLPEEEGCLFKGKLWGKLALPCDRCAEEIIVPINFEFAEFEDYPFSEFGEFNSNISENEEIWEDNKIIYLEHRAMYIDFNALLWEELVLAMPSKPLCDSKCKGICQDCGKNLNLGICSCQNEEYDPRFAALRNLKIQ